MRVKAYAKINLGLDVIRKRPDGYHEVKMVMQTIDVCDELTFTKTGEPGIVIRTNRDDLPTDKNNLIHKAAKLMMDEYDLTGGIEVELEKNIPVAAGLAGGSTDAAAVLCVMNDMYALGLDKNELMKLGVRIGADVPYCIMGGTALSEGIGEILTRINSCPDCGILLAKPPISVSTAYVYQNLHLDTVIHPDIDGVISGITDGDFTRIAECTGNVLESVTIRDYPIIDRIKNVMTQNGAISSLMSGSGPTVFGIFTNDDAMNKAYDILSKSSDVAQIFKTKVIDPER